MPETTQGDGQSDGDKPFSVTIILKFFIFILVAISLFIMVTIGGATSGYSIAIILILSILTLCAFKEISNLGEVFKNKNFLIFTWCFPTILLLILSRTYIPESIRYITDYIATALGILLVLNFLFEPQGHLSFLPSFPEACTVVVTVERASSSCSEVSSEL